MSNELPAQRGGAKALLLTVLGEFVLPTGGSAWTSSLVAAGGALGIAEKNARQAIARIGDQGLIAAARHGRRVRWGLTPEGRRLIETGAERIYSFGTTFVGWDGQWLVAHCPVAEQERSLRNQLRAQLGFLGFGELSASLLVSPHGDRETELRRVLGELGLIEQSIILRSRTSSAAEDAALVDRAWSLAELADAYRSFTTEHSAAKPGEPDEAFRAVVELVHDWRRFPFADPELPTELLPDEWAGTAASSLFHARRHDWSAHAQQWFGDLEAGA